LYAYHTKFSITAYFNCMMIIQTSMTSYVLPAKIV
jgi:hypothetical protein